jgi:hypothetical protein
MSKDDEQGPKIHPFSWEHIPHDQRKPGDVFYSHWAARWIVVGDDGHPRAATEAEIST